jgi:geranylgeranyl diphosphate synthase type II
LVFKACSTDKAGLELALLSACSLELFHTASLVHDDLPCFDNADMRRGLPTVHRKFGEGTAVLTGDALLVRALQVMTSAPASHAREAMKIIDLLGDAVTGDNGIIAGQAMEEELEAMPPSQRRTELLAQYHYRKTAALFRAACLVGATAGRSTHIQAWADLGDHIGTYYQLADDLLDCHGDSAQMGKPVYQDAAQLNMVAEVGERAVRHAMERTIERAEEIVLTLADSPAELVLWLNQLVASVEAGLAKNLVAH